MGDYQAAQILYGNLVSDGDPKAQQQALDATKGTNQYGHLVMDGATGPAEPAQPATPPAVTTPPVEPPVLVLSAKEAVALLAEQPESLEAVVKAEIERVDGPRKTVIHAAIEAAKERGMKETVTALEALIA